MLTKSIKLSCKSANFIHKLPVEATGALENILLEGVAERTKKCRVRVTGIVQPYKKVHDQIRQLGQWNEFVKRCLALPGFRTFTVQEMDIWLQDNARSGSIAALGSDHEGDRIIVENPGESDSQFLLMGDQVTSPNGWTSNELESFIPRPEKTRECKKHTYVLHRSGFRIATDLSNPLTKFRKCQILFELLNHESKMIECPDSSKHQFVAFNNFAGIIYDSGEKTKFIPTNPIGNLIAKMKMGELKSLLQKLIRFSPQKVRFQEILYDTSLVLQYVCECSLIHPGGKSPHTGLYTRGLPNFLKRLAVTMVEDAYVDDQILHDLLLMSIISTNDPNWFPNTFQMQRILNGAQAACISTQGIVYHHESAGPELSLTAKSSMMERSSIFLDMLKSFPWDLTMFRSLTRIKREYQTPGVIARPDIMEIYHSLDHHVGPEFCYFMNPKVLQFADDRYQASEIFGDLNHKKSKPYAKLFREVFHSCSGFNYRRTPNRRLQDDPMVSLIQDGQRKYFQSVHGEECKIVSDQAPVTFIEIELDRMWLAAAVGHIEVRVNRQAFFVFIARVEPTLEMGVTRVPARGQKELEIDPELKMQAIAKGQSLLRSGIQLKKHAIFGDRIIFEKDGALYFQEGKESFIPDMSVSMETDCNLSKVSNIIQSGSQAAIRRVWQLSAGFCSTIQFPKIARDGGPEDQPVTIIDMEAFQICLQLTSVLRLVKTRWFHIEYPTLWWHIRNEMIKPIVYATHEISTGFPMFVDKRKRKLTPRQEDAIKSLDVRREDSNFVIMEVGSGKTLILATHILNLNPRPKHVLFVTPASAIDGVVFEIKQFTDCVEVRDMTKSKKSNRGLSPGFTVLSQDHMRLCEELFRDDLPNCVLVLDEFHLVLCQKTQRTKCALALASGVPRFVAMSGTPSINSQLYDLLPLLAPIAPFELILQKNFFVAFSFAIHHKSCVDIKCNYQTINMDVPKTNVHYWNLLPSKIGGLNNKRLEAAELDVLINESQKHATEEMIHLTMQHLAKGDKVFLVARKRNHVSQLKNLLNQRGILNIYCVFEQTDAITLTEYSIAHTKDPRMKGYDVVICPISCNAGFGMSIFNVQISTIYPSNSAKRIQMQGRIKRTGSLFKELLYIKVLCGRIQEFIDFRYDRDDSLASVLRDLSK